MTRVVCTKWPQLTLSFPFFVPFAVLGRAKHKPGLVMFAGEDSKTKQMQNGTRSSANHARLEVRKDVKNIQGRWLEARRISSTGRRSSEGTC